MRSATITIIGILTLGWVLATLHPPHWAFGEFFLATACMLVVREYLSAREVLKTRGTGKSIFAGNNAWFTDSEDIDGYARVFHPWDSDRSATGRPKTNRPRTEPPAHGRYSHKQSIEQLAHEMLMQAFRHVSSAHDPCGDPEEMRRVSAARDLLLREIHKP
jgi:hypothetical protein